MSELEDLDKRSTQFVGLTPEALARHVAGYVRTSGTPRGVADLLAEARRTFVGASACYDNFASSAFKVLQAAEAALRVKTQTPATSRKALGQLLGSDQTAAVLTGLTIGMVPRVRTPLSQPPGTPARADGYDAGLG